MALSTRKALHLLPEDFLTDTHEGVGPVPNRRPHPLVAREPTTEAHRAEVSAKIVTLPATPSQKQNPPDVAPGVHGKVCLCPLALGENALPQHTASPLDPSPR